MSLSLYVDGDRWRAHMRSVVDTHPGLVPVIKGNGYGFGNHRLARKAGWLGVDEVAVGTYDEVEDVRTRFDGTVLVLTPWRPFEQRGVEVRLLQPDAQPGHAGQRDLPVGVVRVAGVERPSPGPTHSQVRDLPDQPAEATARRSER